MDQNIKQPNTQTNNNPTQVDPAKKPMNSEVNDKMASEKTKAGGSCGC